jgi:hypothetical protein
VGAGWLLQLLQLLQISNIWQYQANASRLGNEYMRFCWLFDHARLVLGVRKY